MPKALLVDTETGEGAVAANLWQMKYVLTRNVTSYGQKSLSGFVVPWLGLALGGCQPKSSNWLVEKMHILMMIALTGKGRAIPSMK